MRTITEYASEPKEREVVVVGDRANIFYRTDIKQEDEDKWTAVEYSAQVNAAKFEFTDEVVAELLAADEQAEAQRVRLLRNGLLADSDKEVLPDRLTKTSTAFKEWAEYRQALRDITDQEGFPYEVIWPNRP